MNCAVHSDQPATGFCRNCGKPMCPACTREVNGALYCEPCLGNTGRRDAGAPGSKPGANPGLAAMLGLIPGLGAVYNGQYVKALIHVLIFGGLSRCSVPTAQWLDALFGIALAASTATCPSKRIAPRRRTCLARRAWVSSTGRSFEQADRRHYSDWHRSFAAAAQLRLFRPEWFRSPGRSR